MTGRLARETALPPPPQIRLLHRRPPGPGRDGCPGGSGGEWGAQPLVQLDAVPLLPHERALCLCEMLLKVRGAAGSSISSASARCSSR